LAKIFKYSVILYCVYLIPNTGWMQFVQAKQHCILVQTIIKSLWFALILNELQFAIGLHQIINNFIHDLGNIVYDTFMLKVFMVLSKGIYWVSKYLDISMSK
jgi:hypothetical protein